MPVELKVPVRRRIDHRGANRPVAKAKVASASKRTRTSSRSKATRPRSRCRRPVTGTLTQSAQAGRRNGRGRRSDRLHDRSGRGARRSSRPMPPKPTAAVSCPGTAAASRKPHRSPSRCPRHARRRAADGRAANSAPMPSTPPAPAAACSKKTCNVPSTPCRASYRAVASARQPHDSPHAPPSLADRRRKLARNRSRRLSPRFDQVRRQPDRLSAARKSWS